jgi:hypothetical protein
MGHRLVTDKDTGNFSMVNGRWSSKVLSSLDHQEMQVPQMTNDHRPLTIEKFPLSLSVVVSTGPPSSSADSDPNLLDSLTNIPG